MRSCITTFDWGGEFIGKAGIGRDLSLSTLTALLETSLLAKNLI